MPVQVEVEVPNTALIPVADAVTLAQLDTQQDEIVNLAHALLVDSPETLESGEKMIVAIKDAITLVHEELDAGCGKANELHKHLTGQRKKYLEPLNKALAITVNKGAAYRQQKEHERREEETRKRMAALKEAEDAQLAEAVELAKAGREVEAHAVLEERVEPPPVVVASTLAKPEGLSYSTTYEAKIVNLELVPRMYLIPNIPMLNGVGRSSKGQVKIPGVVFHAKTGASRRG